MEADEFIDTIAVTQHGLVTRSQLTSRLSHSGIDRRLHDRLQTIFPGVYLVRGHPLTWTVRLAAALLAAGDGATASHRAAAHLHGLAGIEPVLEITTTLSRRPRLPGVVVHRASSLPRDAEERDALRRTRVPRTLIDLAAVVPPASLSAALDDALTRRLVTCGYIERRLDQLGRQGRKGAGVLAELLSQRSKSGPAPESAFERRLFAILAASDVPLPVPQYEVSLPGGRRARLDFAYPQRLLALEADSYRYHSSPRDWARDHNRNRELTAAGWRILPVTWDDLDAPAHLLAAVARGLSISRRLAG